MASRKSKCIVCLIVLVLLAITWQMLFLQSEEYHCKSDTDCSGWLIYTKTKKKIHIFLPLLLTSSVWKHTMLD